MEISKEMVYNVIGLMSGSSLDGLDIAYVELTEIAGKWSFELQASACVPYNDDWSEKIKNAADLPVADFLRLHTAYGRYLGQMVNEFIDNNKLFHKVHFIASHGHTAYHDPQNQTSFQLGDGASIAALTGITVISDLRNKDVAVGGQGAPIVPIADQLLWSAFPYCLNIGGIANITINKSTPIAFDICPANQVLNYFAQKAGHSFDDRGLLAKQGTVNKSVLAQLSDLEYYQQGAPKSLANSFSSQLIALLESLPAPDALATASMHIAIEIHKAIQPYLIEDTAMLITGGGALNTHLVDLIQSELPSISLSIPEDNIIQFKEAIAMALIGALRWREEENVFSTVTGASKNSVGGALWVN